MNEDTLAKQALCYFLLILMIVVIINLKSG